MNEKVVARVMASFEDPIANNLVNCMLYLLLIVLLAHEVEWIFAVAALLLGILGICLIVRWALLLWGKAKSRRRSGGGVSGPGWTVPGFFLLYALVCYLRGQTEGMVIWLILCVVTALGAAAGFVLSRRAARER